MPPRTPVRLGVNIDHVATLRNARGGVRPDPIVAAKSAIEAGAGGITAHLREDRRHIRDDDIRRLKDEVSAPLNLEIAASMEMAEIAMKTLPHACCLVPERREEITTEGGLDAAGNVKALGPLVDKLKGSGIRVSLFIDPEPRQVDAALRVSAPVIELHTGRYCEVWLARDEAATAEELQRLSYAAGLAAQAGIEVHAGHGLDYDTAAHLCALPEVKELNIGHFLIGESILAGLPEVIARMRSAMTKGSSQVRNPAQVQQQQ